MNKIKLSLIIVSSLVLTSNCFGFTGMTSLEYTMATTATNAAQWATEKTSNAAQWGVEKTFTENLTSANLTNQLMSGQASLNGNKAMDAAMAYGGEYGKDTKNLLNDCLGLKIPSFSKGLGLDGLGFCGMDVLTDKVQSLMKDNSKSVQPDKQQNKNVVEEKKELPVEKEKTVYGTIDSSKENCNEAIDSKCKTKKEASVKYEKANGVNKHGGSSTNALKTITGKINSDIDPNDPNDLENKVCLNNELTNGTTEGYSCKKDILKDFEYQEQTNSDITNNNSKFIDSSARDIRENVLKSNEKFAEAITSRVNTSREIRDDYNIRYNPSTIAIKDVETMGENSFYKRNAEYLTNDPTIYIVPTLKDNQFGLNKYGLDKYKDANTQFGKLEITDNEDNVVQDSDSISKTVDRLGGVTPFSSALYGYDVSLSVMSKNIYKNEGGEQGTSGREMALINGLKGVMFQTMMLNQQLENQNRTNYNIRIKEFDKISQDNDNINNKLEQIQNQNSMVIELLKEMNTNLRKIANK